MSKNIDFDKIRESEFPASKKAIHLKASGGSPMCRSAYDASRTYLDEMCFEGDLYFSRYLDNVNKGRTLAAAYINSTADEIGFTVNSSSSATIVADMLKRAGVHRVYYPVGEFPTSVHAIINAGLDARSVGDLNFKDNAADWLNEIAKDLEKDPCRGTCALVASHVCYLNGAVLNIPKAAQFCKARDMMFIVNATQSFGALQMDVHAGVDMLFATGLKWLCAGYGAGVIYVRQKLIDTLGVPAVTGWLSVENPYVMDNSNVSPIPAARSLDAGGGMPHFGPLLSLYGALTFYERIGNGSIRDGIMAVEQRTLSLATLLRKELSLAGYDIMACPHTPQQSGIVSLVHKEAPELFDRLKARNILTSLRTHPKTEESSILRFGVHFFNTKKEIETTLTVLQ